ncbi:MAG: hypothetical protein ACK5IB_13535 [Qingshengfaniella sp.]
MTIQSQKRLAVLGALALIAVFLGANAHLLTVAFGSQPECRAVAHAAPAKTAC